MSRTTLQIDDDVLAAARVLAHEREESLGRVISELARQGLRPEDTYSEEGGFPVSRCGPLPALDGRTPKAAGRSAAGRAAVDLLLREMENHEQRAEGDAGYDFSEIRRRLRLD
ncbi:MAG TPA: hypothetical protein VMV46_01010 [Thermoanaerobaculia bacterium]|nr:hypothetical protein [Thermoanaerobaculia bacterium]